VWADGCHPRERNIDILLPFLSQKLHHHSTNVGLMLSVM
jgi:hypothetical protein